MISKANPPGPDHPPVSLISGYRGLAETLIEHLTRAGHQVSVLVRRESALSELNAKFPNAFFVVGDVAARENCARWVKETADKFGTIDYLINNAAITGPVGKLHELKFEDIVETVDIDLLAPVFLCQQVLPYFLKAKKGVILNLSGGGATSPRPFFSPYGFCKTAIVRFTETLALEYPEFRFYAMSPGILATPMVKSILKLDPQKVGKEYHDAKRRVEQGGEDPNRAGALAIWLFQNQPEGLNGKLVSAIWDQYEKTDDSPKEVGWWTLRRVDEVLRKNLNAEPL